MNEAEAAPLLKVVHVAESHMGACACIRCDCSLPGISAHGYCSPLCTCLSVCCSGLSLPLAQLSPCKVKTGHSKVLLSPRALPC